MSSPPELRPFSELGQKRTPGHYSGSRAQVIPDNAIRAFTKASEILRAQLPPVADDDLSIFEYIPSRDDSPQGRAHSGTSTTERATLAKKVVTVSKRRKEGTVDLAQSKPTRKRNAKKCNIEDEPVSVVHSVDNVLDLTQVRGETDNSAQVGQAGQAPAKKPRKKRESKDDTKAQSKIKKSKIKKADTSEAAPGKAQEGVPEADKALYTEGKESVGRKKSKGKKTSIPIDAPLGLEKASLRRREWTPVKDQENIAEQPSPTQDGLLENEIRHVQSPPKRNTFDTLAEFAFKQVDEFKPTRQAGSARKVGTKRRKLEMIDTLNMPTSMTKSRSKSPVKTAKKKAPTITEKATRQYARTTITDTGKGLLPYLSQSLSQSHDSTKEDRQKPRKAKIVSKQARSSTVLQPEKALQAVNNQDLLFGTSSQLIRDESPDFVRDLQIAMKNSESEISYEKPKSTIARLPRADSGLWLAASRDSQGSLLKAEVVDLTTPPSASGIGFRSTTPLQSHHSPQSLLLSPDVAGTFDIDTDQFPTDFGAERSKFPSPESEAEPIRSKPSPKIPDFSKQTVEALQKQVAKYGFKPVRGKKNLVALLERCWQSKHGKARTTSPTKKPIDKDSVDAQTERTFSPQKLACEEHLQTTNSSSAAPKRRGRPKKRIEDESIDNETLLPFPPRQTTTVPSQPLQLATPPPSHSYIFSKITEAVKTFPPSHDPKAPTWDEKIILYDPIVLEDLTKWLNTVGLGFVGVDEEVAPSLVRDWCEINSVCCMWQMNLRGGERARY